MTPEHPSYPRLVEQVQLLLQCADLADTLPSDPYCALALCAQVVNEMFPDDRVRRVLCFQAVCNVEASVSASLMFTLAADRLQRALAT